jgi:ubiquitin carboxyl-terminal hydrolase L3
MSFVIPLESNPDVLNKFMKQCGISEKYQLVDVVSLDEEVMIAMLPPKVKAFILLFPCYSENTEAHRAKENEELKDKLNDFPDLFYMRQYLHNACGTVAIFHAVLNNLNSIEVKDGPLKSFYEKAKNLTPEERGKLLEQDQDIITIHQSLACEGQTEAPPEDEKILFHFVALTAVNGELFELDGSLRNFPISHGKTTEETFLNDAAKVCRKFMERDEKELRFTVMAIGEVEDD